MAVPFNERLADIMEEKGFTADALGKAVGLSGSIISRWLRRNSSIMSANLLRIAEFFDCSLNFLCGLSEEYGHFNLKPVATFPERLKLLIAESGKSIYLIQKQTQLPRSRFYDWFDGTPPKSMSLIILAQYFGCTVDYLIGRE